MAPYLALIGDILESRAIGARGEVQTSLMQALTRVNRQFEQSISARFLVTIGDEFQALLEVPDNLDVILATLRVELHPVELRFGLGIGGLTTPLQDQAIGMDGPAFYRARTAIERARDQGTPLEVELDRPRPVFSVYSLLYGQIRRGWTDRQRHVFDLASTGLGGVEIAELLDISPSAVSQHLSSSGYKAVSQATRDWMAALRTEFDREIDRT